MLTVAEAAAEAAVVPKHVHRLIDAGELAAFTVNVDPASARREWRVPAESLGKFKADRAGRPPVPWLRRYR